MLPGECVGDRYLLLSVLGAGGMGTVYRARDTRFQANREVAIKVLHPRFIHNPELLLRFKQEANAAVRMKNPGLAQVTDYGEMDDGAPFLVMELLEGDSFSTLLSQGPMRPNLAVTYTIQVLEILDSLHSRGLVHRDIKPDNLFLCTDVDPPRVRILDLGIAQLRLGSDVPNLTRHDESLGTPAYAPLEQFERFGEVDARADIYSTGAVLFHLLTGEPPVDCSSSGEAWARVIRDEVRRHPREICPDVPEWVDACVAWAMEKDRTRRPRNAVELADALRQNLADWERQSVLDIDRRSETIPAPPMRPVHPGGIEKTASGIELTDPGPKKIEIDGGHRGSSQDEKPLRAVPSDEEAKGEKREQSGTDPEPSEPIPTASTTPGSRPALYAGLTLLIGLAIVGGAYLPRMAQAPLQETPVSQATPAVPSPPPSIAGMVFFPGGTFQMGSSAEEIERDFAWCQTLTKGCRKEVYEREQPLHPVRLSPFFLDQFEVTQQQFADWLNQQKGLIRKGENVFSSDDEHLVELVASESPIRYQAGHYVVSAAKSELPMFDVTWGGADRFCRSQGKELPTEAQWEYAARGDTRRRFAWGDMLPRCGSVAFGFAEGHTCPSQTVGPRPVGVSSQDRTPEGVFDLGGNVGEWMVDGFADRYPPCEGECVNPRIAPADNHVVRGGNWSALAETCRAAGRGALVSDVAYFNIGFRCARPGP